MKTSKQTSRTIIFVLLILSTILILSACSNIESPKTCQHQWLEADCLYPSTCRFCYQTQGDALGHSFSEATCTESKTCTRCNLKDGKPLGHTEVINAAVTPTCTTTGLSEGKQCSRCNTILVPQTKIEKLEHSWQSATCENPKTCSICFATEGSALSEHNYQEGKCIYCNQSDPKEIEMSVANNVYWCLVEANELCSKVMDSIYCAWHFAIYEADNYYSAQSCFNAFISKTKLDYDEALDALNTILAYIGYSDPTGTEQLAALRTFSVAVDIVVQTYYDNGTFDKIDKNLSSAKSLLKSLTNKYADYTGYPTLMLYYSEISSYADFCKSPTGSFNQLQTTISTYETNLRTYKNKLSFIFE